MKIIKTLWIMKYVSAIITYKERKHINVSFNVKIKIWKSVYLVKLETPKNHLFGFWHPFACNEMYCHRGDFKCGKLCSKQKLSTIVEAINKLQMFITASSVPINLSHLWWTTLLLLNYCLMSQCKHPMIALVGW